MATRDRNSAKTQPCVVFDHVPKAGGVTLISILRDMYRPDRSFFIQGNNVRGSLEAFRQMPAADVRRFDLVAGHNACWLRESIARPTTCITMLRDPVKRIVSMYYYVLASPDHYLHDAVARSGMSLSEFVSSSVTAELDNHCTNVFAKCLSASDTTRPAGDVLQLACHALSTHFAVAGVLELFDETLILMKHTLRWRRDPLYRRRNVTKRKPRTPIVDEGTLATIRDRNELDIELYKFVRARFEDAVRARGEEFAEEVAAFSQRNRSSQWKLACRDQVRRGWRVAARGFRLGRPS